MSNGSADRLLSVLDLFAEDRLHWSQSEMMDQLGYARPTLYRYLKTLCETGFLSSMPGGTYTIGPRVVELDFLMRKSDRLVAETTPHLSALAKSFPGTAFLCKWYGAKLLCVASESRSATARSSYPRGRPMPMTRGAVARIIIAHLPKREQMQLVRAYSEDFAKIGQGDTPDAVRASLKTVRRQRVAIAFGEVTPGIVGTSSAVLDSTGRPLAALCVSMEADLYRDLDTAFLTDRVRSTTATISAALEQSECSDRAPALQLTEI